jgi:hypothetical protein
MVGALALSMTYGLDILPENDPNMEIAQLTNKAVEELLTAGYSIVDIIPMLKYLPSWLPGGGFQSMAARSREQASKLRDGIFQDAYNKWVR